MESLIITICGLMAAGWAAGKIAQAITVLRAHRRAADGGHDGDAAGISGFGGGSTSGDSGHGHCNGHGGDCGGHGGGHGGC